MKDVKYVCENCGSDDIEELSWTKVNTKKYVRDACAEIWCPVCDCEVHAILKNDFRKEDDDE